MDKNLKSALAKYGTNPPRFLWKHLPVHEQRRLVLESIRKELQWLGAYQENPWAEVLGLAKELTKHCETPGEHTNDLPLCLGVARDLEEIATLELARQGANGG